MGVLGLTDQIYIHGSHFNINIRPMGRVDCVQATGTFQDQITYLHSAPFRRAAGCERTVIIPRRTNTFLIPFLAASVNT